MNKHTPKKKWGQNFLIDSNTINKIISSIDFTKNGNYQEYEAQSKQIQQDILGDELYEFMRSVDNKIPLNF